MSRKIIRYSDCFKRNVVSEVEKNGLTIQQARDRFGIKGTNTIQLWLKKYGRNHLLNKVVRVETKDEINELKQLREENKRLKIAYAELAIDHKLSEKVLEKADELMGLDLKKKYEQALSQKSKTK
ncbi:MAG TPA: transposase [Bacteroidales bacterium]|nr:transposase [Bacteroidales bacterium]